jgi:hypothetical protein
MSETTSHGRYQEINQREDREDPVAVAQPRSKRRRWIAATVILVVSVRARQPRGPRGCSARMAHQAGTRARLLRRRTP